MSLGEVYIGHPTKSNRVRDWQHRERRIQFADRAPALMLAPGLDPDRQLQPARTEVAQRLEEARTEEDTNWVEHRPVVGRMAGHMVGHMQQRLVVGHMQQRWVAGHMQQRWVVGHMQQRLVVG